MEFIIGQKFEEVYPPEAAVWCNENSAVMTQVDGGFEIQVAPEPAPTPAEVSPVIITSDNITIADADFLMAASTAGEKTAAWLIAKLEL